MSYDRFKVPPLSVEALSPSNPSDENTKPTRTLSTDSSAPIPMPERPVNKESLRSSTPYLNKAMAAAGKPALVTAARQQLPADRSTEDTDPMPHATSTTSDPVGVFYFDDEPVAQQLK